MGKKERASLLARHKRIIALALVVLIGVAAVFLGFWIKRDFMDDDDGDGIVNSLDSHPNQYNFPATSYAKEKLTSSEIIDELAVFNDDLELDSHEKAFIDYISSFDENLQQKVIDGFLFDGNISSEEVHQLNFLNSLPKADQMQCVENGSFANFDWDGDQMNNDFERNISHTPYDVYNGRYAILVDTHNDTSIIDNMYNFLINEQKFLPQNVIKLAYTNATKVKFIQATSELSRKVSGNDFVYVMLAGHGSEGIFSFMSYKDIDTLLDNVKYKAMVIAVSACGQETSLEPLKEGPSPRVVMTMPTDWIFATSKNYNNDVMTSLPKQYDPVKSKDYDIDGNGYVSIKESFETQMKSMQRYFSEYPKETVKYGMSDLHDISKDLYLGDFEIQDQT